MTPVRLKNLADIDFPEKADITSIMYYLGRQSALDPYKGSIYLIVASELGNKAQYSYGKWGILALLTAIENGYSNQPAWMLNNSFLAWMWGRAAIASASMNDIDDHAVKHLIKYLDDNPENPAFNTWAWGYRAALNNQEYEISKDKMLKGASQLTEKPDALWAWVMNLQAAAFAGDVETYNLCKKEIMALSNAKTVSEALVKGLLRTPESNDYPAWALAKVRYSAKVIKDDALYAELESSLNTSIAELKNLGDEDKYMAEYALAVLENQLAIHA